MDVWSYIWAGMLAVFAGPEALAVFDIGISITLVMVIFGFLLGIVVGAIPGLGGPTAMAIALPILISVFGFAPDALLPVMGCLIGIMKGATIGGAVPAILFNTPGTPDSYMTTLDGYPMAQRGQAKKALRIAHFSSASGDTFSDVVLIVCAPFLALLVEAHLDLPEKTALLILSLSFVAAAVGGSVGKGLIATGLGLLAASVGTGEDFYPRLSLGAAALNRGFPIATSVLGVLIVGGVFHQMTQIAADRMRQSVPTPIPQETNGRLTWADRRALMPVIARSAVIGTVIGALPGIGSTLAASIGYTTAKARYAMRKGIPEFGQGAPQGVAATEAANSSVSGANMIPVLSLGIPGNTAAVFLILAAESIGGFAPGPSVFRFTTDSVNPELVIAFGLFTCMFVANLLNWTIGGIFMRSLGFLVRVPKQRLLPVVLVVTLTAVYVQDPRMEVIWFTLGFGVLGFGMRLVSMSPLPFVIAFILGGRLEDSARQAFAATGGDPWFLLTHPLAAAFVALSVLIVFIGVRSGRA